MDIWILDFIFLICFSFASSSSTFRLGLGVFGLVCLIALSIGEASDWHFQRKLWASRGCSGLSHLSCRKCSSRDSWFRYSNWTGWNHFIKSVYVIFSIRLMVDKQKTRTIFLFFFNFEFSWVKSINYFIFLRCCRNFGMAIAMTRHLCGYAFWWSY